MLQRILDALSEACNMLEALPTWLVTISAQPFLPEEHPWKRRRFTLADWAEKRTQLCQLCDLTLWGSFILFAVVVDILVRM